MAIADASLSFENVDSYLDLRVFFGHAFLYRETTKPLTIRSDYRLINGAWAHEKDMRSYKKAGWLAEDHLDGHDASQSVGNRRAKYQQTAGLCRISYFERSEETLRVWQTFLQCRESYRRLGPKLEGKRSVNMTHFRKLATASALLALSVSSANALDVGIGGGATASVGLGANSSSLAADAVVSNSTSVETGASDLVAAGEAVARGETAMATSSDGLAIGMINDVSTSVEGDTQISITIDPSLALERESVTFRGDANINGEGEVVLPMTQAEFVTAVKAGASASTN